MPRRSSSSSSSVAWVRCCLVMLAMVSALCVSGPALFWRFKKSIHLECLPCDCNCSPPISLFTIAPGLDNFSVTDCETNDPELKQEMQKQFGDLLDEELKLQEVVTEEHMRHANITFNDARRVALQYQKEAEKCNAATEICEEARERTEALMTQEKKLTSLWEQRARQMGWHQEQ